VKVFVSKIDLHTVRICKIVRILSCKVFFVFKKMTEDSFSDSNNFCKHLCLSSHYIMFVFIYIHYVISVVSPWDGVHAYYNTYLNVTVSNLLQTALRTKLLTFIVLYISTIIYIILWKYKLGESNFIYIYNTNCLL